MKKNLKPPPENQRFRDFRIRSKKRQHEIADVLGISSAGVSNIETGRAKLTESNIRRLSIEYKLNPDWLRLGNNPIFFRTKERRKKIIPIITDIPAGEPVDWYYSYEPGFDDGYIDMSEIIEGNLFAVRVHGDSMEPTLKDGDILIIDPHKQFMRGLAVVRFHDGYTIKNVRRHGSSLTLTPVNPVYDEQLIEADEETFLYVPIKIISIKNL